MSAFGTTVTPSASATIQSPSCTSTSPTTDWPPIRPGCSFVAPRNAIIDENAGKPCASSALDVADAAVDHETDDAARLGAGGEHLAPVAALGFDADARDEHVSGAAPSATATWIARLSPAAQVTGNAGALMRAPCHAALMRGDIGCPPLSPSVADPSCANAAAYSSITAIVPLGCRRTAIWRRARDLNPRGGLSPPTRLAGEHLRPLGQPSGLGVYEWPRLNPAGVVGAPLPTSARSPARRAHPGRARIAVGVGATIAIRTSVIAAPR